MPGDEKPADGQQGGDAAGIPAADPPKPGRTFTQDEIDAIIEARLKRAIPPDYEELKALKATHDAAAEAEKTELQKAKDAAALAEANGQKAQAKANALLIKAAITVEAGAQGAVDAATVVALLAGSADITIGDDGEVKGAKNAVKALLTEKAFLKGAGNLPGASGGEFKGNDPKDRAAKIADLEQKAWASGTTMEQRRALLTEARALKIG